MPPNPLTINWPCLQDAPPETIGPKTKPISHKTFAQALNNVCDIPMSQFPETTVKGNDHAISIPEDEYEIGIETCKHNLHARIIWPKGATPLTVHSLREKLKGIWKSFGRWGISSIGKGFYELCFSSIEDARTARSVGSLNLNPGLLKLFAWSKDFNPTTQKNSSAQVWLRIYGLAQEYWRPKILFAIASSAGNPICTDANTGKDRFECTFGQYARVLIDIDLEKERLYRVLVERKGYAMFIDLDYEQIPDFCTSCRMVGHALTNCRKYVAKAVQNDNQPQKYKIHEKAKAVATDKTHDVGNVENQVIDLENELVQVPVIANTSDNVAIGTQKQAAPIPDIVESRTIPVAEVNMNDLNDVNDLNDESSSSASEFVEATQLNENDNRSLSPNPSPKHPTPARIQKDMEFLNVSWANLAEHEDANEESGEDTEIRNNDGANEAEYMSRMEKEIDEAIIREEQQNLQASGFQLVTSKASKKAQKAKTTSVKNTYATRSNTSNPKPFR